ncbi:hypothetical protein ACWDN2_31760, partial [Streptomyces cinereoruber]
MLQLLGGLHALVAELYDVHAGGEHGVEEGRQVALALPGAEIIPVFSRKPMFGYIGLVAATIAIAGLSVTV